MAMNMAHRLLCRSPVWERRCVQRVVPWVVDGVDSRGSALEIGPGYGANIAALRAYFDEVAVVEIDPVLAAGLEARHPGLAVTNADGANLPMPEKTYDTVTNFTMLHHVPTTKQQDSVFDEAFRVLRPGGVLAGCDTLDSISMRVLHVGDVFNPLDVNTLRDRLGRAGFTDVDLECRGGQVRMRAVRPHDGTAPSRCP
ncbi:MAG: class I SAM-dependent methyltransferase [Williamsia sp.]|nr:class I SAM-dependent methyltransferase [Williamsia sp.]